MVVNVIPDENVLPSVKHVGLISHPLFEIRRIWHQEKNLEYRTVKQGNIFQRPNISYIIRYKLSTFRAPVATQSIIKVYGNVAKGLFFEGIPFLH